MGQKSLDQPVHVQERVLLVPLGDAGKVQEALALRISQIGYFTGTPSILKSDIAKALAPRKNVKARNAKVFEA